MLKGDRKQIVPECSVMIVRIGVGADWPVVLMVNRSDEDGSTRPTNWS